jgi:hypothetical protein
LFEVIEAVPALRERDEHQQKHLAGMHVSRIVPNSRIVIRGFKTSQADIRGASLAPMSRWSKIRTIRAVDVALSVVGPVQVAIGDASYATEAIERSTVSYWTWMQQNRIEDSQAFMLTGLELSRVPRCVRNHDGC